MTEHLVFVKRPGSPLRAEGSLKFVLAGRTGQRVRVGFRSGLHRAGTVAQAVTRSPAARAAFTVAAMVLRCNLAVFASSRL